MKWWPRILSALLVLAPPAALVAPTAYAQYWRLRYWHARTDTERLACLRSSDFDTEATLHAIRRGEGVLREAALRELVERLIARTPTGEYGRYEFETEGRGPDLAITVLAIHGFRRVQVELLPGRHGSGFKEGHVEPRRPRPVPS